MPGIGYFVYKELILSASTLANLLACGTGGFAEQTRSPSRASTQMEAIKNIKQTAVITILKLNFHFTTLTFRVLVNIHFQKYNRYEFLGKQEPCGKLFIL